MSTKHEKTEKTVVNIRMHKFVKLVFDSFTNDLQITRGENVYASDALLALLEQAAPKHVEKVRQLHPDLWKEMTEDK